MNRSSKQRWNGPRRNKSGGGQQQRPSGDGGNPSQWQRKYDDYKALAESADRSDQVTRENYWQHAEHYIRLINDSRRPAADQLSDMPAGDPLNSN